jgi:LDH2 family malate/lactate/ureidoglycolate dehydrogenase
MRYRHGKGFRHRHGICQALKPFRYVCLVSATSIRLRHDELGVYELLAGAASLGRQVEAHGCLSYCMMDVFSGVLSGSAFAGHVTNPYDPSKPADVGHFLIAIKPDLFLSLEEFKERMDYLYQRVVESDKMHGVERIYFPGEIEQLTHEERLKNGIPLVAAEIEALDAEARLVGANTLL